MMQRPFTTGEIAGYCHVTHRAVLKWIVAGKLKAYRTPGQHSRIQPEDFLGFLNKYNMPVPKDIQFSPKDSEAKGRISVKKRILIVDDDKEMVNSIKRNLIMEEKYDIEEAYNGFSAGNKFAHFHPDLVILDIRMPGMDGYEVCSRIRSDSHNREVKIIAISGAVNDEGAKKIIGLGANVFLPKPFDISDLKNQIDKLIQ